MAVTEADIRRLLAEFIGHHQPTLIATVKEVDETKLTCTLDDDGTEFLNVRMQPVTEASKGIVKIPKIGAFVLASQIEATDELMVVSCTEYDKIIIVVGSSRVEITDGDISVNNGSLGGMVKITELTSKLNALVQSFNSHTHPTPSGTSSPTATQAATFSKSDYENTAFKH